MQWPPEPSVNVACATTESAQGEPLFAPGAVGTRGRLSVPVPFRSLAVSDCEGNAILALDARGTLEGRGDRNKRSRNCSFISRPRRPTLSLCSAASAEGPDLAINRDV